MTSTNGPGTRPSAPRFMWLKCARVAKVRMRDATLHLAQVRMRDARKTTAVCTQSTPRRGALRSMSEYVPRPRPRIEGIRLPLRRYRTHFRFSGAQGQ